MAPKLQRSPRALVGFWHDPHLPSSFNTYNLPKRPSRIIPPSPLFQTTRSFLIILTYILSVHSLYWPHSPFPTFPPLLCSVIHHQKKPLCPQCLLGVVLLHIIILTGPPEVLFFLIAWWCGTCFLYHAPLGVEAYSHSSFLGVIEYDSCAISNLYLACEFGIKF